jgi:hypothetical protein
MKSVNTQSNYQVIDNNDVQLIIETGDAALLSASIVYLEDKGEIARLQKDQSELVVNVGQGSDLKGKRLRSISMVADLIGGINMTRINYRLSGGVGEQIFDAELSVEQPKDVVVYQLQITFI